MLAIQFQIGLKYIYIYILKLNLYIYIIIYIYMLGEQLPTFHSHYSQVHSNPEL